MGDKIWKIIEDMTKSYDKASLKDKERINARISILFLCSIIISFLLIYKALVSWPDLLFAIYTIIISFWVSFIVIAMYEEFFINSK